MKQYFEKKDDIFDGFFSSLWNYYPSIEVYKYFLNVIPSSTYSSRGDAYEALIPKERKAKEDVWLSESYINSSYTFSFYDHKFAISSYSMRSRSDISYNIPYEWILEASNDNITWDFIHHKPRDTQMIGPNKEGNWEFNQTNFYRTYKLTQIGENYHHFTNEKYIFSIETLEIFGVLMKLNFTGKAKLIPLNRIKIFFYFFVTNRS